MSSVSVNPPKTPVTKGSNGTAAATIPNVCKMPGPPAPFIPVPLPNIGKSGMSPKDYSQDVTIEGKAVAIKGSTFESMGDMASKATGGGLISANTHGITKFVGPGSMDVTIEGKNVQFLSDPMLNNCAGGGSPANAATMLGIMQMSGIVTAVGERTCPLCGATDHEPLEETPETQADADALANEYEPREAQEALNAQARWDLDTRSLKKKGQRPLRAPTMLGVVHCKTDQKYADKSGVTNLALVGAGNTLGMETHNPATHAGNVGNSIMNRLGNSTAAQAMWALADQYSALSLVRGSFMPIGYPPGSCAAQGAVVLCLDDGGLPKAMSEKWYSPPDRNVTTGQRLWFYQAGSRTQIREAVFQSGDTVPPCMTCSAVLPWLLCFKKEDTCTH